MGKNRYYRTDASPENLRAIWSRLHDINDQLTGANTTIAQQQALIASLQSGLTSASRNATQALIAADVGALRALIQEVIDAQPGGGGGGGGAPPPPPGPPPGPAVCSSQPLSASLPGWFRTALIGAGQSTTENCYSAVLLAAIEADCNANDFTLQRDSGCNVRGRLYHQGNHGMWGTFCGFPDASAVADYRIDVVVSNSDGSISWGWV